MVGPPHDAAEREPGGGEARLSEADVEGHVRVVRVHVEPEVLPRLVRETRLMTNSHKSQSENSREAG